jgi:hypothetical protein
MTTPFVQPSDDIIYQEGTFGYSFLASGAISGGQLVKSSGPMYVVGATAETDNALGVAAYKRAKGEELTIYGPGNIVRCFCPSTVTQGNALYVGPQGGVISGSALYGSANPCIGICLESKVAGSTVRVLLK